MIRAALLPAPLLAGLAVGAAAGQPALGAIVGGVLSALLAVVALLAGDGGDVDETALLAAAGLEPGATDDDIARRGDALAEARARRSLARDHAGSIEARREEVRRLADGLAVATAAQADACHAWDAWLDERGIPAGSSPEVVRQVLAAAGIARRAAEERDEQRRIVAAVDHERAELDRRTASLLLRMGMGEHGPVDGRLASLLHRLERSTADRRTAQEAEARRRTLVERRGPVETAVRDLAASVAEHLEAVGCAAPDELRSRAAAADERRTLHGRLREARANLAGIAGGPDAVEALRAQIRARDLSTVEADLAAASSEAEALEAEERRLVARVGELDARIRSLESAEELGTLRQELAGLEGQASSLAREWAVKAVTGRLLAETRSRYERERQPDVVRAATSHLSRFTGGRYARIVAAPGDAGVRVETDGGEERLTDELSRGTAEQLYLALRFGLVEEFARHAEPLPVVMDDILVNFAADRAARAADAVRDLATRHQVIYLTCHVPTARMLDPGGERTVTLA